MSDAICDLTGTGAAAVGGADWLTADELPTSALFRYPTDVAQVRARLQMMLGAYMPGFSLTDPQLWHYLTAAEADAEQRLRVFFGVVEVIPLGTDTATYPPTEPRWIEEPGYDYTPDDFIGNRWGMFTLRHHPIVSIQKMTFYYPSPGMGAAFDVPLDWIRADKKYGKINLVPTSHTLMMPLNAYVLSVIGGGRVVPLMLQVRYKTGLQNIRTQYPNLVDLIVRMAAMRIMLALFLPQSGSVSADGLSQSTSWDFKTWGQGIDDQLEALRQAIHGVRFEVF